MDQDQIVRNASQKPLWQRVLIYLIPALLLYGLVYYSTLSKNTNLPVTQSALPVTDHTVTYTDAGFSPSVLTVNKNSTVVFKNVSEKTMHIASNPHPLHNAYPTENGCISSTFDSCTTILPGQSWSFTFSIAGAWGYHNHLNPNQDGTIIVR